MTDMNDTQIQAIRRDFPFFAAHPQLVYLDSAATALKPQSVIDAMDRYYAQNSVNIKRGVYDMAAAVTEQYEAARSIVAGYIHAAPEETVFVRNATEGINLVMYALGTDLIQEGDEIVTTIAEHHSNFVPWQQLAASHGADLRIIDVDDELHDLALFDDDGKVALDGVVTPQTKLMAITHVSNVLGVILPIAEIVKEARRINPVICVVVDGAQGITSLPVDVAAMDCDFYVFSGHKLLGPTGIGVVWGKKSWWDRMRPFQYGGDMIHSVAVEKTTFAQMPERYEAGTPAIAEAIGLGAAIEYMKKLPLDTLLSHKQTLVKQASEQLSGTDYQTWHVDSSMNAGVITLSHPRVHAHDLASVLDDAGVLARAGHHCAQPLHTRFELPSTLRLSLGIYTTESDLQKALDALDGALRLFS